MKKIIYSFFIPVAVGITLAFFNKEKVDLKYSISEPIPIPSENRVVQQLKLQNVGNTSAENLIIDLTGKIRNYELKKYSEKDEVQEFKLENGIQLCYPALPPSGIIIIRMDILDHELRNISVKHNKGQANEVFSSKPRYDLVSILFIVIAGLYLYFSIKYIVYEDWISIALKYDRKKIFNRKKPFLLSSSIWDEIKRVAVDNELLSIQGENVYSVDELKSSKAMFYLQNKNLDCLNLKDSEKKDYISKSQKAFLYNFEKLSNVVTKKSLVELFSILRPELFEESDWIKLREEIISKYKSFIIDHCWEYYDLQKTSVYIDGCLNIEGISLNEKNQLKQNIKKWWSDRIKYWIDGLDTYYKKANLIDFVLNEKPELFLQNEWEELLNVAKTKYAEIIFVHLYPIKKDRCEEVLKNDNDKFITQNNSKWEQVKICAKAYYKMLIFQDIIDRTAWDKIEKKYDFSLIDFSEIKKIKDLIDKSEYIEKLFLAPIEKINEIKSPESIAESLKKELMQYFSEKDALKKMIAKESVNLLEQKELVAKLMKQLDFINTFLENPSAIDRVEDYENLFSKGNYKNFKKIKNILERETSK